MHVIDTMEEGKQNCSQRRAGIGKETSKAMTEYKSIRILRSLFSKAKGQVLQ